MPYAAVRDQSAQLGWLLPLLHAHNWTLERVVVQVECKVHSVGGMLAENVRVSCAVTLQALELLFGQHLLPAIIHCTVSQTCMLLQHLHELITLVHCVCQTPKV